MLQLVISLAGSCFPNRRPHTSPPALSPPVTLVAPRRAKHPHHGTGSWRAGPAAGLGCNYPPATHVKFELHQLPAQPGNSSRWPSAGRILPWGQRWGPQLTTIRVSLAGSVSMAKVPPTMSWLMRVPSVPSDVSRALHRPSPAAALPGGCPGGTEGRVRGSHSCPWAGISPVHQRGSFCLCDTSLRGLSPDEQHRCDDRDAGKSSSGQGWPQDTGTGDRHPRPGEQSCQGGVKGSKTPLVPSPAQLTPAHKEGCEALGMGKMQLWQWGTSTATSSVSPPPGRVGVQASGQTPTIRKLSLVPSCHIS